MARRGFREDTRRAATPRVREARKSMAQTATVTIDFLAANAIVAALQQRHRTLTGHVENGVSDPVLDAAIRHTLRAEDAVRRAFHLQTEAQERAAFEAVHADLEDFRVIEDIPLALLSYMAEGR